MWSPVLSVFQQMTIPPLLPDYITNCHLLFILLMSSQELPQHCFSVLVFLTLDYLFSYLTDCIESSGIYSVIPGMTGRNIKT